MILSALFSFLSGSAFRMIWGEVSAYFTAKQEHQQELERMKLQNDLETARNDRDMARLKLQSDLGIKEIQIQADAALSKTEADAFVEAMKNSWKPIGIAWVDAWNGVIRPVAATVALAIWATKLVGQGFVADDFDKELLCGIMGFYFADRSLGRRGK